MGFWNLDRFSSFRQMKILWPSNKRKRQNQNCCQETDPKHYSGSKSKEKIKAANYNGCCWTGIFSIKVTFNEYVTIYISNQHLNYLEALLKNEIKLNPFSKIHSVKDFSILYVMDSQEKSLGLSLGSAA